MSRERVCPECEGRKKEKGCSTCLGHGKLIVFQSEGERDRWSRYAAALLGALTEDPVDNVARYADDLIRAERVRNEGG